MRTLIAFAILATSICLSTATFWGGWGGYGHRVAVPVASYGHSVAIPVASYGVGYGHGYSSPSYALSYGHGHGYYPSYSHGGYYGSYWKK